MTHPDGSVSGGELPPKPRPFYGWYVVAGAFAVTFVGFGNPYSFGEEAPRGFLALLSPGEPELFKQGSVVRVPPTTVKMPSDTVTHTIHRTRTQTVTGPGSTTVIATTIPIPPTTITGPGTTTTVTVTSTETVTTTDTTGTTTT